MEAKEQTIDTIKQMVVDGAISQEIAEKYFPQLAESEDDKIRRGFWKLAKQHEESFDKVDGIPIQTMIEWLYNKKSEVPECIYPKFSIGDTITKKGRADRVVRKIFLCQDPVYVCETDEGETHLPFSEQDEWEKKYEHKWCTADEEMLEHCIGAIHAADYYSFEDKNDMETWLKSLKPHPNYTDEDKKRIERIASFIWKNRKGDTDDIFQQEQDAEWLKSLI